MGAGAAGMAVTGLGCGTGGCWRTGTTAGLVVCSARAATGISGPLSQMLARRVCPIGIWSPVAWAALRWNAGWSTGSGSGTRWRRPNSAARRLGGRCTTGSAAASVPIAPVKMRWAGPGLFCSSSISSRSALRSARSSRQFLHRSRKACHWIQRSASHLFQRPEADGRSEVHTRQRQHAGHNPRSLDVQVCDQHACDQAARYAFNRNGVRPSPMPRQQGKQGRHKHQCHHRADGPQNHRCARPRTHPCPGQAAHPHRHKKGGEPDPLQKQIADEGAEGPDPVDHHARAGCRSGRIGGRVPRRIRGVICREGAKEQNRDQRQHDAEEHVQRAAPRGREGYLNGLHRGVRLPVFGRRASLEERSASQADGESQSNSHYPRRQGGNRPKPGKGNQQHYPRRSASEEESSRRIDERFALYAPIDIGSSDS